MARRVTISDVANLAGVSLQTVSRVINNKPEVSPETRERVLQVVEQTGYRPSGLARGLATSHTATIGMIVPDISNPFFSDIARSIETTAYDRGYNVFLCNTNEVPERELDVLYSLEQKHVDGVILNGLRQQGPELQKVLAHFPAVVFINRLCDNQPYPAVLNNDRQGAKEAVQHLIRSGRTAIGMLTGPDCSYSGACRQQGYADAMSEAGLLITDDFLLHCPPTVPGGAAAAYQLLQQHPKLDALFCYNDLVAVGAVQACKRLGRRIPDDVAIIGFDDIYLASLVSPSLSTCRVPRNELGHQAISLLLRQIDGEELDTSVITLSPELIFRESAPAIT